MYMIGYKVECDNILYKKYSKKPCRQNKREVTYFTTIEKANDYAKVMGNSVIECSFNVKLCSIF